MTYVLVFFRDVLGMVCGFPSADLCSDAVGVRIVAHLDSAHGSADHSCTRDFAYAAGETVLMAVGGPSRLGRVFDDWNIAIHHFGGVFCDCRSHNHHDHYVYCDEVAGNVRSPANLVLAMGLADRPCCS